MAKYQYTIHAEKKLAAPTSRKLGITKARIQNVIKHPVALDTSEKPVVIAIGTLTAMLSLCVAYRKVKDVIRIITFYPAEKGRYEHKVLSG